VGLKVGLDGYRKSRVYRDSIPVANRYSGPRSVKVKRKFFPVRDVKPQGGVKIQIC
jgi:hypothetical protein